jgi:hypothetical protein
MKTQEDKIKYLRKLLNVYLKFSRHYNSVDLTVSGKDFMVRWHNPKQPNWYSFESVEVPLTDLDARIASYKGKLQRELKKRNNGKTI